MNSFHENSCAPHWQGFSVEAVLHRGHTGMQDVLVFENSTFGRVLVLDGMVQLTDHDNHIYHEMLAHVPLTLHGSAKRVLIVGGGDGGILREVLKHPVDDVRLVEIDSEVIALSQRFFPEVSGDAFDDPRVRVVIEDAVSYVANCHEAFDVVIVDSTDPIGPGSQLFSREFYGTCRDRLLPDGILAAQSGCAPYQTEQLAGIIARLRETFGAATPFVAPVPSYPGGMLPLVLAARSPASLRLEPVRLRQRLQSVRESVNYYSPEIHAAVFALADAFVLPDVDLPAQTSEQPALAAASL